MKNNNANFQVRRVVRQDSRRVWEIRNHPVSRRYSGSSDVITFTNHEPWFENKYFSGRDNSCFVLTDEKNVVIGYCRFDYDDEYDRYVVSIALDPNFHGR